MSKKLDLLVEAHTDKASQKAGSDVMETCWRLQDSIYFETASSWMFTEKKTYTSDIYRCLALVYTNLSSVLVFLSRHEPALVL